jgi:LPXTG-motif cell wall-anchored protein
MKNLITQIGLIIFAFMNIYACPGSSCSTGSQGSIVLPVLILIAVIAYFIYKRKKGGY